MMIGAAIVAASHRHELSCMQSSQPARQQAYWASVEMGFEACVLVTCNIVLLIKEKRYTYTV